ncbi:MAG: DMT family transporter [Gammaproteobacteria bacterium]|nr:MAG: DMT family transporter [Gammaproteobacteria bacterium]UCH41279.1 MAG: DMT family transporter [Gammaproteobacteria bacterium]
MDKPRSDLLPSLGLAFGAALWGLYWIPVRGIEQSGVSAYWTGPVIFAVSTLLFVPLVLIRWRNFAAHWHHTLIPGLLAGFAFSLYIASLNLTDVVRAILLFYMSPLWSTLLGIVVLKERLTGNRVLGLLLAFTGLYIVLVVESGLPIPRNTGDWFALISGLCWSVASVKLFQDGARYIIEKVTIFIFFALLLSLLLMFWQLGNFDGLPGAASLVNGWYWIALVALLMLPITYLTIWPATVLSPGRVGMLLMVEVIVGVASAAMLTEEQFGLREFVGAALIISAGVVEVLRPQKIDSAVVADPDEP